MKHKITRKGLFYLAILAGLLVIVGIYWTYTRVQGELKVSAEKPRCTQPEEVFRNFRPTRPPKPVPDTAFRAEKDRMVSLADYKGSGVVLNFWATWCAPCVREMPALDRLTAAMNATTDTTMVAGGVRVLTVSEDRRGEPLIRKFYKVNKIRNLPVLADAKGKLLKAFGILVLPTTVLISPDGLEVGRVIGIHEWDSPETENFLRACLRPAGRTKAKT